jgi:hypothetical protein
MAEAVQAAMDGVIAMVIVVAKSEPSLRDAILQVNRAVTVSRTSLRVIDGGKP